MKILHTITSMDPRFGGVCQAVRTIATSLQVLGAESDVVSFDNADADFVVSDNLKVHGLGTSKGPWAYNGRFESWLRENMLKYDTIIIHGMWQYQSYATAKVLRSLRRRPDVNNHPRLFLMPHGMLDPYFQKAHGRKLKAIRNFIYWKLIEQQLVSTADGILFTCEEERVLAAQSYKPYRPQRELVVGLGVEQPPTMDAGIRELVDQQKGDGQFLLFLSRIHEKKGVDLLLEGFKNLTNAGETRHRLVVAGPGMETPYGKHLQSIGRRSETANKLISYPGMLSGSEKWASLYGCSAFILPSHQENFGIAVVEALACGKPVLISNQVNIWREIAQANCGLVADDTVAGVEEILRKWEKISEEERTEMGIRARQLFETQFEVSRVATRMISALMLKSKTEV